jgi:hypothetical protein
VKCREVSAKNRKPRVLGLGFRVEGLGVAGLGLGVWVLGFRA